MHFIFFEKYFKYRFVLQAFLKKIFGWNEQGIHASLKLTFILMYLNKSKVNIIFKENHNILRLEYLIRKFIV